jgi:two-component system, NtrC family, response regulator HydG
MKVLAVGAHPDDIEFGVGGTLLKHKASGDELHIIVLTSGELGGSEPEVREREAAEAAALLGADITFCRLHDGSVPDGKPTIDVVERVTRRFTPTIAYIHSVNDTHQDHRAAAYASQVALRNVNKLYAYQAPSATTGFTPQRYPDITPYIDSKMNLVRAHKSQHEMRRYLDEDYVLSTARYWGLRAGCHYTEPMEVIFDRDEQPDVFTI